MSISARNVFEGTITALTEGPVNAEVELTTAGGDKVVAVVTEASVKSLGLAISKPASAFVKAPWVMVLAGDKAIRFSARNHMAGTVQSITKGGVNSGVAVALPGGTLVHSVITNEAVMELGLKVGGSASVLFKASNVILGVPA